MPTHAGDLTVAVAAGPKRTSPVVPLAVPAGLVLLVVLLLCAGLVMLLGINTAVAEDAFRVHELRQQSRAAAEHAEALEREVQALRAPDSLSARASALGLGPAPAAPPVFLRVEAYPDVSNPLARADVMELDR